MSEPTPTSKPKASIVIPCYNAEKYLAATLDSALAQTMSDLEIVCVNNNSTDGTADILASYAARDPRIRVLSEAEPGEGPARDAGLVAARGEWLYFLDADDLMFPQLLERAIACAEREQAQIVVFRTITLDDQTGEEQLIQYSWRVDWLAEGQTSFSPREQPNRVFNSFQNWVHNKLFNGDFVRSNGFHFQHVHRSADILFTCHALSRANRVALLDEPLHKYRVNNPQSAMATSDSYPLDFFEGFLALRKALEADRTWDLFRTSYVNWAIEGVVANVDTTRSLGGYRAIVNRMLQGGIDELGIADFPLEQSDNPYFWNRLNDIRSQAEPEVLYDNWARVRGDNAGERTYSSRLRNDIARLNSDVAERDARLSEQDQRIRDLEDELARLRNSRSFRLGNAIAMPYRTLRHKR